MHTITLLAAATVLAAAASAADFFPLETGNTWTYKDAKFGQTFTVKVGLPYSISDKIYYSLKGYSESPQLVRIDERDQLVYLDEERQVELPLTSFEPFEGGWWDAPFRQCDGWGQTLQKRGVHEGPSGNFRNVLEVRYRAFACADAGVQQEQFVENIGMLRRVSQSFTGPRTFDLVSARVGKLRIDTAPNALFRVSVEAAAEQLAITLSLESKDPVKLEFPSGQEYELQMRDSDGRVVWTWSAEKSFIQALHERFVSGLWMIAVNAPRPTVPGDYTIQAWLTTMGDAPLFAATVPVTIGR